MAVTRPGDVVAVEAPGFYAALQALERLDLRAVEIPVDPRTGLDLDALANALDRHDIRACWFMTNFQNPTGVTLSAEKRALVALLAARDVPLIEDDVYGELHFGPDYPLPARAFDRHGLVMHCSSFSKTLAPGYRIGWAAAGRFAEKVQRLADDDAVGQHSRAGRHRELSRARRLRPAFAQAARALHAQLDRMDDALRRWLPAGVEWVRPEGGYFLWLAFPDAIDAMELHRQAIARGISFAPGPLFSAAHGFERCVRVNFGHPWSRDIERAIRVLGGSSRSRRSARAAESHPVRTACVTVMRAIRTRVTVLFPPPFMISDESTALPRSRRAVETDC